MLLYLKQANIYSGISNAGKRQCLLESLVGPCAGTSVRNKTLELRKILYGKSPPVNTEKPVSRATQHFLSESLSSGRMPHLGPAPQFLIVCCCLDSFPASDLQPKAGLSAKAALGEQDTQRRPGFWEPECVLHVLVSLCTWLPSTRMQAGRFITLV